MIVRVRSDSLQSMGRGLHLLARNKRRLSGPRSYRVFHSSFRGTIWNEVGREIVEAYAGPDNVVQNMTASEWVRTSIISSFAY